MVNPEKNRRENERVPEEILETIKEAIEKGKEIEITQLKADGGSITNKAFPICS